jgi:hypothetical protein
VDRYRFVIPESRRTTDQMGLCELTLGMMAKDDRIDNAKVSVSKEGYATWISSFGGQDDGHTFEIALTRGGIIEGTVRDAAGNLEKGAAIFVEKRMNGALLDVAFTDEKGRFATRSLEAGTQLTLFCYDRTLSTLRSTVPVRLKSGERKRVNIGSAATRALTGRLSIQGTPCAKALVFLDAKDGWGVHLTTGDDGAFTFENLPPDRYRFFANIGTPRGSRIYLTRILHLADPERRELTIDFGWRISGTAFNARTQEPLPHDEYIEIAARRLDGGHSGDFVSTRILEGGTFHLFLDRPGVWALAGHDNEDYVTQSSPRVDLTSETAVENVAIFLLPDAQEGKITVRIVDAQTGKPLKEGWIETRSKTSCGSIAFEDGMEVVEECGIGTHFLFVGADKYVPVLHRVDIEPGRKTADLDVALSKSDAIRVMDVLTDGQAQQAGMKPGDLIHRYGEARIRNLGALIAQASSVPPDVAVAIGVIREGQEIVLHARGGPLGIAVENALIRDGSGLPAVKWSSPVSMRTKRY